MSDPFVYVLTVEHRHGTNLSAHATREHAEASLFSFVEQFWGEVFDGEHVPGTMPRHDAIAAYFDRRSEDEWHTIEQVPVEGSAKPGPFAGGALISHATDTWASDDINFDEPALVSEAETGCWVQGWLWIEGWCAEGELKVEEEEADA